MSHDGYPFTAAINLEERLDGYSSHTRTHTPLMTYICPLITLKVIVSVVVIAIYFRKCSPFDHISTGLWCSSSILMLIAILIVINIIQPAYCLKKLCCGLPLNYLIFQILTYLYLNFIFYLYTLFHWTILTVMFSSKCTSHNWPIFNQIVTRAFIWFWVNYMLIWVQFLIDIF